MTTPNDNTPTPTPRVKAFMKDKPGLWRNWPDSDLMRLLDMALELERELAEAKSKLEATERARAFAMENSANLISAALERDAARADAQRWRECAEAYSRQHPNLCQCDGCSMWSDLHNINPCPSPTPSSQPSSPTATASPAPETATASRLAEHESKLALLLRRTDWLMGQLFNLDQAYWEQNGTYLLASSLTAWPDDLILPTSTSTSQPTSKPSGSGEGSCG